MANSASDNFADEKRSSVDGGSVERSEAQVSVPVDAGAGGGTDSAECVERVERPERIMVLRDFCQHAQGTSCDRCVRACPHQAISFAVDGVPTIDESTCTNCGICLGICDTFSSTRVTMPDLHARIRRIALRGEDVVLTCTENIFPGFEPAANVVVLPCLACLSPEFWTIVLTEDVPVYIAADLSYCADCDKAGELGETLFTHAIETAEAWSGRTVGYLDEIPEKDNLVRDLANPAGVDRRSAFANLAEEVSDIASGKRRLRNSEVLQEFYERRERSRALARLNLGNGIELNSFVPEGRTKKTMWPKRKLLLEALERDPAIAERIPLVISEVDCARCTNELCCTSVCPTGARYPHPESGILAFDVRYCSGCGLCVEACPKGALELTETTAAALLTGDDTADSAQDS